MATPFLQTYLKRRTHYALKKESPVPASKIVDVVKDVVKHTPTSFNSQSNRAIVLLGAQHDKLWDQTFELLKPLTTPEQRPNTQAKINGFKNGFGTVLFFEDANSIKKMQEDYPLYAAAFPTFAAHSSGAAHIVTWTALTELGLGCNLQHYNQVIEDYVTKEWNVPENWKLQAQLVFGTPAGEPGEKTFLPIDETVKVSE
ncbi:hypothetical protein CANCADRAFT_148606 [Tortispora caseinolytica NRRL Y-17796]|uniref:Nitroreductase domain-containing protein n=1 Tax=Tortispora caseinolytica NRRL Y-17796 TaxID=767744 RepID=A0A1E4TD69_9ASCO|nr:hypothetical protein CANCADRAFT_148606 [Tortispora caseinolytica NRRL Y-17796]